MRNPARSNRVTILGIDPGSIACGYGLIATDGRRSVYVASGVICPPKGGTLAIRLRHIYHTLLEVIRNNRPDEVVVEKIFFAKSARAALSLGHARGVALLAAAVEGLPVHEWSALQVKKAVVGYGHAEKRQVQEMVKMILGLGGELYPDSADALALALCHVNALQFNKSLSSSAAVR